MNIVEMNAYKVVEMNFKNELESGTEIKLENKYSYNVKYSPPNKCVGEFAVEVYDKNNPEKFYAKTKLLGFYTYQEGIEKEKVHVAAFKEIFPYAKSIITTISANGGVPPIILPNVDIEKQSIYRFDMKK